MPADLQQDLPKLLEKIAANEKLLLDSVPSVAAEETVVQENLDKKGFVHGLPVFTGHYSYLVRAHLTGENVQFKEGRSDENWRAVDPNVPSGYPLVKDSHRCSLQLHPYHQDGAHFRLLGRQVMEGKQDYVIAFAQVPEKSEMLGAVLVNGKEVVVAYQGLVWVDPDNFQVVRMCTDLLRQRPEVGSEMTDVQFHEMHMPVVDKSFWLPRNVIVTRYKKDGSLQEKHQFTNYRIFVQSEKDTPVTQPSDAKQK